MDGAQAQKALASAGLARVSVELASLALHPSA